MIAYEVDAFEVEVPLGDSGEEVVSAFHDVGIRSVVKYMLPRPFEKPEDVEGRCVKIVGVGCVEGSLALPRAVRQRAFAIFAPTTDVIRDLALKVGKGSAWRNFACKADHLPCLRAYAQPRGRWYVCYAGKDTPLPEGIDLARAEHPT